MEKRSVQRLRAELIAAIYLIENEAILTKLKFHLQQLLHSGDDFWANISDSQKAYIENGIADNDAGRNKPFEEVMKKYQN